MATVSMRGNQFVLDSTGEAIDNLLIVRADTDYNQIPIQTLGSAHTTYLQGDPETTAEVKVLTPSQAAALQGPPSGKVNPITLPPSLKPFRKADVKKNKALDKKRAEIKKKWNTGM